MDAATTNKVLERLAPNNIFSKMCLKDLRRKRTQTSATASSRGRSFNSDCGTAGITDSQRKNAAPNSAAHGIKIVRFDSRATVAQTIEYVDYLTPEEERSLRWYDKKELRAMFLKDLEENLNHQVHHSSIKSTCPAPDGRGLELHFAHNQPRKYQAERYVKAVVDKSYAIRKTASSYSPIKARRKAYQDVWAEDLAHYACQYAWMARDWALAEAAEDEAQARDIYNQQQQYLSQEEAESSENEDTNDDSPSVSIKSRSCISQGALHGQDEHLSSDSENCHNLRSSRPWSFTAKSA